MTWQAFPPSPSARGLGGCSVVKNLKEYSDEANDTRSYRRKQRAVQEFDDPCLQLRHLGTHFCDIYFGCQMCVLCSQRAIPACGYILHQSLGHMPHAPFAFTPCHSERSEESPPPSPSARGSGGCLTATSPPRHPPLTSLRSFAPPYASEGGVHPPPP